jgi:uncharacterized protein (DUF58 family)
VNRAPTHDHLDSKQFELAVKHLADSLSYGGDPSIFLGAGNDYVQSRPYQLGDPVRWIDWRVTGRTGRVHVKEFQATKQTPIYILMDTSASMCVSSLRMSKYAWGVQLAAGLALVAQERMSPVGMLGCGDRNIHVKPTLSDARVMEWAHALRHFRLNENTSLGAKIRGLAPSLPARSMLIVISDLHDPEAIDALKLVSQAHDCVVLQLQDPAERGAVGGGIFRATEAETDTHFVAHGGRRWMPEDVYLEDLRQAGVDCLLLPTNERFLPKLRQFLKRRVTMARGHS